MNSMYFPIFYFVLITFLSRSAIGGDYQNPTNMGQDNQLLNNPNGYYSDENLGYSNQGQAVMNNNMNMDVNTNINTNMNNNINNKNMDMNTLNNMGMSNNNMVMSDNMENTMNLNTNNNNMQNTNMNNNMSMQNTNIEMNANTNNNNNLQNNNMEMNMNNNMSMQNNNMEMNTNNNIMRTDNSMSDVHYQNLGSGNNQQQQQHQFDYQNQEQQQQHQQQGQQQQKQDDYYSDGHGDYDQQVSEIQKNIVLNKDTCPAGYDSKGNCCKGVGVDNKGICRKKCDGHLPPPDNRCFIFDENQNKIVFGEDKTEWHPTKFDIREKVKEFAKKQMKGMYDSIAERIMKSGREVFLSQSAKLPPHAQVTPCQGFTYYVKQNHLLLRLPHEDRSKTVDFGDVTIVF